MKRKITQAELDERAKGGAVVSRRRTAKPKPAPKEAPAPEPKPEVNVDLGVIKDGMAAMAASIKYMAESQERISERVADELVKISGRTSAEIRVTERNSAGGIDAARIDIIE